MTTCWWNRRLQKRCLRWLPMVAALAFASLLKAESGEPFQCLSAVAWQRQMQFRQPTNDKEAFSQGPFARPQLKGTEQLTAFALPVGSKGESKVLQLCLSEGLRQLHAFDETGAESWFREALSQDRDCVGAWLGLAIANERWPQRALYFLDQAAAIKQINEVEKSWLGVYRGFFESAAGGDIGQRLNGLAGGLQELADQGGKISAAAVMAMRYRILASHIAALPVTDAEQVDEQLRKWQSLPGGADLAGYGVLLWIRSDAAGAGEWVDRGSGAFQHPMLQRLAAQAMLAQGKLTQAREWLQRVLEKADTREGMMTMEQAVQDREPFAFNTKVALAWTSYHLGDRETSLAVAKELLETPRKPAFTNLMAVDDDVESLHLRGLRVNAQLLAAWEDWDGIIGLMEPRLEDQGLLVRLIARYWTLLAYVAKGDQEAVRQQRLLLDQIASLIGQTPYLNKHGELANRMKKASDAFVQLQSGRLSPFLSQLSDLPVGVLAPRMAKAGAKDVAMAKLEAALKAQPGSLPLSMALGQLGASAVENEPLAAGEKVANEAGEKVSVWAPGFSLADKSGAVHELKQFNGQPVLVIFFLGQGCVHCVEQLQKFQPQIAEFEKAGVRLVGIGTDSVKQLAEGLGSGAELNPEMPYLLLADPEMKSFRQWNCYDEFAAAPLHGTFLLDGKGKILWSDISHDPYVHAEFLVSECRRLLAAPAKVTTSMND